ncbi:MAG TPA: hypothetical protein VFJ85_08835 [Acidimicrobiales bacterium]|nr:hypothetical protein [Acidimicrobiales bacterium]
MLLAEIEIRHSRAVAPTRRVALGDLFLPTDGPNHGGILLAGILGAWVATLPDEERDGIDRLLWDLEYRGRVAQPRLRHRFQTDVVGLDRSRHRLVDQGGVRVLELDDHGAGMPQVLGSVYAASRLESAVRPGVFRLLRRATRWEGDPDERMIAYLAGDEAAFRATKPLGDERWALEVLGFSTRSEPPRSDIIRRFRALVRDAHPDHGAESEGASTRITELTEARRILLGSG